MNRYLNTARKWTVLLGISLLIVAGVMVGLSKIEIGGTYDWLNNRSIIGATFVSITTVAVAMLLNINWLTTDSGGIPATPETTSEIPLAGSELEQIVARRVLPRHLPPNERTQVQAQLQETTILTIQRTRDVSHQQAERFLEQGEWTENRTAAAFLGETTPPPGYQLRNHVSNQLAFQYGVRQTAIAIVAFENEHGEA
ncbi:hypothetical protein [Haladaptatus sp. DYF46]|uniref:DUF7269 family protein n=1 Tax=Haladaptatus sp. DYF46 TaxID=2886041 RepID=UPI001E615EE7|nr:hypothetical protein [Haladaptatus sp. DYF46]